MSEHVEIRKNGNLGWLVYLVSAPERNGSCMATLKWMGRSTVAARKEARRYAKVYRVPIVEK